MRSTRGVRRAFDDLAASTPWDTPDQLCSPATAQPLARAEFAYSTVRGMSGKSVSSVVGSSTVAGAGQPGGKGRDRLSPQGVQEGQEVDPALPPVQVRNAAE
jgi:hypothetical protein